MSLMKRGFIESVIQIHQHKSGIVRVNIKSPKTDEKDSMKTDSEKTLSR